MGCSGAKLGKSDRQIAVRRGRRAYIFRTAMVLQCVTHVMMENELLFERPGSRWCIKLFLAIYGSFMKAIMRDTRPSIAEVVPNQPVNPQLFFSFIIGVGSPSQKGKENVSGTRTKNGRMRRREAETENKGSLLCIVCATIHCIPKKDQLQKMGGGGVLWQKKKELKVKDTKRSVGSTGTNQPRPFRKGQRSKARAAPKPAHSPSSALAARLLAVIPHEPWVFLALPTVGP